MGTSAMAVVTLAGLGLAVSGCTESGVGTSTPTPTGSTTAAAPTGGPVASCVTGEWRSTSASGQAGGGLASGSVSGGSGVAVKIGPTGATTIDFSAMQPVNFTARLADTKVAGTFSYAGQATGTVRTGVDGGAGPASATPGTAAPSSAAPGTSAPSSAAPGTSAPSSAAPGTSAPSSAAPGSSAPSGGTGTGAGSWAPIPPLNWGDTRVTVKLTEPAQATLFDNVRIAEYVGDGASRSGDVVDIQPLLGEGRYQCTGDTLTLTPKDAGGLTWVLRRP
jgi:hypothetical protein